MLLCCCSSDSCILQDDVYSLWHLHHTSCIVGVGRQLILHRCSARLSWPVSILNRATAVFLGMLKRSVLFLMFRYSLSSSLSSCWAAIWCLILLICLCISSCHVGFLFIMAPFLGWAQTNLAKLLLAKALLLKRALFC